MNKVMCLHTHTDFLLELAADPRTLELSLVFQLINSNAQLVTPHSTAS